MHQKYKKDITMGIRTLAYTLICLLCFGGVVYSQGNEVAGLKLPANRSINYNDVAAVRLRAESEGKVKWLVVGSVPGLSSRQTDEHTLVLDIPNKEAKIFVYAVAWVGGNFTEFAKTVVAVTKDGTTDSVPTDSTPVQPDNSGSVLKTSGPVAITVVLQRSKVTKDIADTLNSAKLKQWVQQNNHKIVVYYTDTDQNLIVSRGLQAYIEEAGGTPALILQGLEGEFDGIVLDRRTVPTSVDAFIAAVNSVKN